MKKVSPPNPFQYEYAVNVKNATSIRRMEFSLPEKVGSRNPISGWSLIGPPDVAEFNPPQFSLTRIPYKVFTLRAGYFRRFLEERGGISMKDRDNPPLWI